MKVYKIIAVLMMVCLVSGSLFAGNPDRQGEAGAYELLMNPWAKSSGIHGMSTSFCTGVEAMRINVAGVGRINKTEVVLSNAQYFSGSGLTLKTVASSIRSSISWFSMLYVLLTV